ncbi:MAG: FHA domain-containing protein [Bdellovibrionota bacterium]|nr:FHA domain-containing protein [Bdellovibrionota bacterium]
MKLHILLNAILEKEMNLFENNEYIIGRDRNANIVLNNSQISRKHARIFFEDGSWQVELLSKTGSLKKNQLDVNIAQLEDKDSLQIANYTLSFSNTNANLNSQDNSLEDQEPAEENQEIFYEENQGDEDSPVESFESTYTKTSHQEEAEEFDDETTAGGNLQLLNQLRIVYEGRQEDYVKIIGNFWTLGRSDNCDVKLKDSKASRKHIVIKNTKGVFKVKDLGSSNGSFLNGNQLNPDKEYPLLSGDCIEIGSTKIYFEQKDERFEDKIQRLPIQVHNHAMISIDNQELAANGNFPVSMTDQGGGEIGFVRPDAYDAGEQAKKRKFMIYAVVAILGVVAFLGMDENAINKQGTSEKASTEPQKPLSPFEALSSEQQDYVQASYSAAHRFFTAEQWDLCISELEKVHRFLPEGYSNPSFPDALPSKQMLNIAETAAATLRDQARLEEEKKAKAEFAAKLESSIQDCERRASQMSLAQAESCLEFVFSASPDDPRAMAILESIKERNRQKQIAAQQASKRRSLVLQGEELYNKARAVDRKGDPLDSIDAYEEHIKSSYPDPNNLKVKSRARVNEIRSNISAIIEKLREELQDYFESEDQLREAILTADKIIKLNPNHTEATDKRAQAVTRLNAKLREEYQDSIFKEAHGDIDRAKKIWRRIISLDVEGGEYFNKAQIKLKKHGG